MSLKTDRGPIKEAFRSAYPRVPVDSPQFVKQHTLSDGSVRFKGRYTLGQGMHGKVVKAFSVADDCFVAIKSERLTGRTSAEEMIHRSLRSRYVVQVKDVCDIGSKHYIVMELGDCTLKDVAHRSTSLTRKQVDNISRDLLNGLQAMHTEHVYHRDVKPGNLVMVGDTTKIIDFGKSVRQPSAAMRRTYERADAWAACRVIATLEACLKDPYATSFRRRRQINHHPLLTWAYATPHITIRAVMNNPSLRALFQDVDEVGAPEHSDGGSAARGIARMATPFRRCFEYTTSKMPLIRAVQ